jgi:heparin/heparan-sulfate lyase
MGRLVRVVDGVLKAKPPIHRENYSGHTTGFYGVHNCLWFIGCTAFGSGIETERVNQGLVWGHDENLRLLEHRRKACGSDGGAASPTLGYAFGAYPWAEQNFLYTWLSATGENIAPQWPHSARFANYVIWNWIAAEPGPLEFGYGDTPHTSNRLPIHALYSHMANIRHLFAAQLPEEAALARYVQELMPPAQRVHSSAWFVYPFLLTDLDAAPAATAPRDLPTARFFEQMGQLFMRSGTGLTDTYCLFTCGGNLSQHRHYDALNLVVYHRGFLALDSGTRHREFENGQHLANYFAQTVAHNCVLIHQPGEPPARYWGGTVEGNHGGQHRQLGSVLKAFSHNDAYVYAAGDATACYAHGPTKREGQPDLPEKCSLATRQVVFLLPDRFVVFDRVTATDPTYRKEWLLHTANRPEVQGQTVRADHGQGRLFCRTLLPEDAALTVVGGPGTAYWAAGRNWEIVADDLKPEQLALIGQWRLEVSPGDARSEDSFLHVFQVGSQELAAMAPVRLLREGSRVGVEVSVGPRVWTVEFETQGDLGGRIRAGGETVPIDTPLATAVQTSAGAGTDR